MKDKFSIFNKAVVKYWQVENKRIHLTQQIGHNNITVTVEENNQIYPVPSYYIEGVSNKLLENPRALQKFLEDTYVKLAKMSDGNYKISINQRLKGGGNIIKTLARLWPNGEVPYQIDPASFPSGSAQHRAIMDAINHWHKYTNVRFVPKQGHHHDYVIITTNVNVCSSEVGRMGGAQFLRCELDFRKFHTDSMIHELGHVIGMYHEHCREDRLRFIQILRDSIIPEKLHNFDIKPDSKPYGDYDHYSIMHYSSVAFPKDGKSNTIYGISQGFPDDPPTIAASNSNIENAPNIPLQEGECSTGVSINTVRKLFLIHHNTTLSAGDIETANYLVAASRNAHLVLNAEAAKAEALGNIAEALDYLKTSYSLRPVSSTLLQQGKILQKMQALDEAEYIFNKIVNEEHALLHIEEGIQDIKEQARMCLHQMAESKTAATVKAAL